MTRTELLADTSEFQIWKTDARRDDWHQRFVGSDIRQLIGEVERLTALTRTTPGLSREHLDAEGFKAHLSIRNAKRSTDRWKAIGAEECVERLRAILSLKENPDAN